jgi:hypothetical protein
MPFVDSDVNRGNPPAGVQAVSYPLEIISNLMVAHLPGGLALVDTGSPFSIDGGRPLDLMGQAMETRASLRGVLEVVSQELGRKVEWLIGNNVLRLFRVELNWTRRAIFFGSQDISIEGGQLIPVAGLPTVPIIAFRAAACPVSAFLDTGAGLSYAHPRAVAGLQRERTARDVHPFFGEFETEVYRLPIEVGARAINVEFGVLPPSQRLQLVATDGWILGSEFFRERRVILDYQNDRVIDCPPR